MSSEEGEVASAGRQDKASTGELYSAVLNASRAAPWVSDETWDAVADVRTVLPELHDIAQNARAFVRRVTRYLIQEEGIRQIIDLGSGLPTDNNTHEVAHTIDPEVRVLYVDSDPNTAQQCRNLVTGQENVSFLEEDVCNRTKLLRDPETHQIIDFDQPIGLMAANIVHLINEDECSSACGLDTHQLVRSYVDALPSGSFLALSHATTTDIDIDRAQQVVQKVHVVFRDASAIRSYFDGTEMLPAPYQEAAEEDLIHLDWSNRWGARYRERADRSGKWVLAGVGRKP